jgi:hypothetical protein
MSTRAELTPLSALVLLATAAILAAHCVLVALHTRGEPVSLKFLPPEIQPSPENTEGSPPPETTQPLFPGQPVP